MAHQLEQLFTVVQAEAMTGRKASTWRRDILQRKIAYVKIGRQVRIPRSVIDELISEGWRDAVESNGVADGHR